MSDPIDRQALIKSYEDKLAEAKEIRNYFAKLPNSIFEQSLYNEAAKAWKMGIGIAREMPTIDAVPVVRCRECVHYIKHDKRCGIWNHGGIVPYGFCFLGERSQG